MRESRSDTPGDGPAGPVSREGFRAALKREVPPPGWSPPFRSLWWEARGNWEAAHDIAQELPGSWGYWMHAYLHRKEGDLWNAGYWYKKAGVAQRRDSLDAEFEDLLEALLDSDGDAF